MIRTKELYEQTLPVSKEEQVAFNTFNKDYHIEPVMDEEDMTDYWRERQEDIFNEQFNAHFENRYEW